MSALLTYSTYILLCSDNSYYTGMTNHLSARILQHHNGEYRTCYTFRRRPVKLVFSYHFDNPDDAIAFEKQIKGWRRAKKEALIAGEWDRLPELSMSYSKKKTQAS